MNRKLVPYLAFLGLNFMAVPFSHSAEADQPKPPAAEEGKEKDKDGKDRERRRTGNRDAGINNGNRDAGREAIRDAITRAAPGGPGGMMLGGRGANNASGMASRMLGIDIDDPKSGPKLEVLPLGIEKRLVLNIPVGGVDNPSATGAGWKMESIFKLTDEQAKAVETLREEYKTEQKTLDKEIIEQQKALAEKVKQLRQKYELRANDVLTGDDKIAKEKMDALAKDTATKNAAIVTDALPLYDQNDMAQSFAMIRSIREKSNVNVKVAEVKLVELIPADNRARIQEVIKQQAEAREQSSRWMAGRGAPDKGPGEAGRGGEGRRREGGDPVKPPQKPEATEKKDF